MLVRGARKESPIEAPEDYTERRTLYRISRLLDGGGDVNGAGEDGWTLLHHASLAGYFSVAEYLLDHGAYVNMQTVSGGTPTSPTCCCAGERTRT